MVLGNMFWRIWTKFDLSGIQPGCGILEAKLWLHVYNLYFEAGGSKSLGAYFSSDDSWSEGTVTWLNQPSFNQAPTDTVPGFEEAPIWKCWNVAPDVANEYAWDKTALVLEVSR